MAYLRSYRRLCDWRFCSSSASQELRDRWNGTRGYYCAKHAKLALREQEARESK